MQFRKTSREGVSINIAPLVDVVFLLVIFFAVSTTFLETSGLKLELPEASTTAERQPQALTILMTRDGELSFEDELLDAEQLATRLSTALEQRSEDDKVVVLRADTDTRHGKVVEIMDLVRSAGASGLTVAARPAGE